MKFFSLILFLILFPSTIASAETQGELYDYPVIRVIDGDTVVIKVDFLPSPLRPELSVRIYGVDTPEKGWRAGCDSERNLSESATAFVKQLITQATVTQIILYDWDKYGGRVLGDILIDGVSLREMLLNNGYAREYTGGKKSSWCETD